MKNDRMTSGKNHVILSVILSAIMISSMVAPVAGASVAMGGDQTAIEEPTTLPAQTSISDTIEVNDNLSVWERAATRPATIDRSQGDTVVDSPTVNLFFSTEPETIGISTEQEAVFTQGQEVEFELESGTGAATEQFDGDEFRVLVARFDPDRDATEAFLDAQNASVDDVRDALEGVDGFDDFEDEVENQDEVSFELVRDFFEGTDEFEQFAEEFSTDQEISTERALETLTSDEFLDLVTFEAVSGDEISSGEASASINLDEPGGYVLVGHVGGDVLQEGEEQPSFNDTTVIAADGISVQETESTVTVPELVERGENISITANSNLAADNVSHAAVVFDEETLSDQTTTINVTDEPSTDLRSEDIIIESQVAAIQGVANVQPNTRVSGTTLADERFAGTLDLEDQSSSFFSVRNALVDGFDIRSQAGDAAEFETTSDTILNASITAIGGEDDEAEIDIETLEEWGAGEYTVVHVATDEETGEISTNRENVALVDTDDVDIDNPAVNETEIEEGDTVQVSADVTNNGPVDIDVTATVTIDGVPSTDPALTRQVTIGAGETETVAFDVPRDTAGEFALGIQIEFEGNEIGSVTAPNVTVTEPTTPPRGGGGVVTPPDDDPDVDVEPPEPPAEVNVEVDETVDIEFDEETGTSTAAFSEDNTVESVTFGLQTSGSVNARTLDREPDETGPSPGASVSVSQITVGEDLQDQPATIRMRVSLERLEEVGADADDLQMNRYNADEGEWQGLETDQIGQTDTHVRVEAETPGFSFFSVSATSEPTAAIDVPAEVEEGDEVTLDASASEDEYGEIVSYDWSVDGESLSGETVTTTLENPGEADIELTVTNDAGETDTASTTVSVLEEVVDDPDDGVSSIVAVVVVVLVIMLAAGVALYARSQDN